MEEEDDAPPGRLEALPRPTGRARKRRRNDATATATRTLETRPRPPRGIIVPPGARAVQCSARSRKSRLSAPPPRPAEQKFDRWWMEPSDGAAHRRAAGMAPRTATSRRRRWLLAAGVGCVHVDPARPAPSHVARPPHPRLDTRHRPKNQSPYSPAAPTHPARPLPPQVRRRAGCVRREAGVPRRHRRGPRVHRPVAPSEEE